MTHRSLEDKLREAGDPVTLTRNLQIGPYVYPTVPAEFSNWRDEQVAWRETCALFDQSHHMTDLQIEGPDALGLLSDLGVNSFASFPVHKAKQFVACNPDGYVIGDAILFHLDEEAFRLVGRPSATTGSSTTPRPATTTSSSAATSGPRRTRPAGASCTASSSRARRRSNCSRR
jgi:glycine cleavage system aminomethyltransferase T